MRGMKRWESRRRTARSVAAWAALGSLLLGFGVGGAAAESGTLRVGISETYPPLAFQKDGVPAGAEVDLARAVGKRLGEEVVFVPMSFAELVPALEDGRVDVVMSGLSVTAERSEKVRFAEPYLRVGQMALIRANDLGRSVDPGTMGAKGSRVGVKKATTGEGWAKANLPDATVVSFDTVEDGTTALENEEVDYFVHDAPTVWRLTGRFDTRNEALAAIYRPLTKEYLAWAVGPDDEELVAKLNTALAGLRESGQLRDILDTWIPVTKVAVPDDAPQPTAAPPTAP